MANKIIDFLKNILSNGKKFENNKEGAKSLFNHIKEQIEKDKQDFLVDDYNNSSIFIAGAPGAGKTEFVETILDYDNYIIIDIDNYRSYFKGYNGKNAEKYQDSCSRVATGILEYCLKNNLKFIFDGTLSSEMGKKNIKKVLKKNRKPNIVLVYQDPMLSYFYTKIREEKNQRSVNKETFLRIYYASIKYCFEIKKDFFCSFIVVSKDKERKGYRISSIENQKDFDKRYKISYNRDALIKKLILVDNIFNNGKRK